VSRNFWKSDPSTGVPNDPSELVRHFRTPVIFRVPDTDGNGGMSGLATNDMPYEGGRETADSHS